MGGALERFVRGRSKCGSWSRNLGVVDTLDEELPRLGPALWSHGVGRIFGALGEWWKGAKKREYRERDQRSGAELLGKELGVSGEGSWDSQGWRKDRDPGGWRSLGNRVPRKGGSAGGSVESGVQVLMGLSSPAVKPWEPRSTPSAECRIPGLAPAPDPGPAPGLVLAPNSRGAAGGGRPGAHEGESVPCRMGAGGQKDRHCGGPAGVFIDVPTLEEMPGRHPSTLSFRPRSLSEWKWCRKKTGPSLPDYLVLILQRRNRGPFGRPVR